MITVLCFCYSNSFRVILFDYSIITVAVSTSRPPSGWPHGLPAWMRVCRSPRCWCVNVWPPGPCQVNHPDLVLEDVPRVGHATGGTAWGLMMEETEETKETEETEEKGDGVVGACMCSTAISLACAPWASACAVRRSPSPPPVAAPAPRAP